MKLETLLNKDIEIVRSVINARLTDVESKLRVEVREQKVDTINWLVGLFITLALMIMGLYLKK